MRKKMPGHLASWLLSCPSCFAVAGFLYQKPQLLLDGFLYIFRSLYITVNNSSPGTFEPRGGNSILLLLARYFTISCRFNITSPTLL